MCRLCLRAGPETSTVSIFSIANGNVIAEIVEQCLGIAIVKDSTPYENVCPSCIVSLVSMHEMYQKYQECNRTFIQLCHERNQNDIGGELHCKTAVYTDVHEISALDVTLEDIIEEDYSIDEASNELESALETLPLNEPTDANYDVSVHYLQDFRPAGEMDGLLHGQAEQHQLQQTDESEWNHPDTSLNTSLMEELSAQVARLDGQEITNSKTIISVDTTHTSILPQLAKKNPPRDFLKRFQNEATEVESYQDPKHQCYICNTNFHNDVELVNHFPSHFLDVPQGCALCGTRHRTVMDLNRHLAYHQSERPYKCDKCARRFSNFQSYRWHTSEYHTRQQNQTLSLSADADINRGSQTMVCDICGKVYLLAEPYEQHILQHEHGHQLYQCKLCERKFPRNIYLLFHLETHAKQRPHRCQYCLIPFASQYLKNFHEKRHPNGDGGLISQRCPLCLTSCRAKHRLLAHIEAFHPADTRIQLLQCSFNDCRLKFLDLNEFQSHITDHRVGDRFPCMHCARVFKRQRLLNTHLRTVHGITVEQDRAPSTLRCEECSTSFRSERTFAKHFELSHRPQTKIISHN
ncbi:zinc finger protein 83-like [Anopheles coustani]|uniref:zinc finger protein 83-like n=1 Tax=Anopheles coustani TaxID=139045 RepID=UPI002658D7BE|nr:zinc finger protein 83-like [Anopheles coustani]